MRFLLAFFILCAASGPVAVGWAVFLCLWKIGDMADDLQSELSEKKDNKRSER